MTVLLTSRLDALSGYVCYWIDELGNGEQREEYCADLFRFYDSNKKRKRLGVSNQQAIVHQLISLAGYHTYAIELLAKSAKYEPSLETYLKALKESGFQFPQLDIATNHSGIHANAAYQLHKLFNMKTLSKRGRQQQILWDFTVLPKIELSSKEIREWLGYGINDLDQLVGEGWLAFDQGFSLPPLVRETMRLDFKDGKAPAGTAGRLVELISKGKFSSEHDPYLSDSAMRKFNIAESVLQFVPLPDGLMLANIRFYQGKLARRVHQMSLSKAYYIDALQGYQVLEVLEAGKYQGVIAKVYSQLANDIEQWDDKPKAEMHLRKAIDICITQLDKGVTDSIYEVELGRAYNRLGSMLINEKGRRDEARTLLQQALKIRKRLMKEDFLTYSADVAETYSHLGSLGRNEKEEKNLICKALDIYRVLDSKMPGTYIIELAMTCSNLSNLLYFRNMGNKVEIERAYRETIDVFRRMDDEHLGAISGILTWEYWHLGSIISADSNRRSEAKDLYQEALDVLFRLEEQYPRKFARNIARIYLLFLELISSDKDLLVEAEPQHRKAVKIFRR